MTGLSPAAPPRRPHGGSQRRAATLAVVTILALAIGAPPASAATPSSVGHRSTLLAFHKRHLELSRDARAFTLHETAMPQRA